MESISFHIHPVPPFRLDLTAWALRRRRDNIVDRWEEGCYRRALVVDGATLDLSIAQRGGTASPELEVTVTGSRLADTSLESVAAATERLLGTRVDLTSFYRLAGKDARVANLAERFMGLKPPCFPSVFEALVNAMACQQISLTVGILMLNRLSITYGPRIGPQNAPVFAFPRPEDLALLAPPALCHLGFSRRKATAMIALACSCCDGSVDLERLGTLPDSEVVSRLGKLQGVGRWSAEYTLLRGLGRLHAFPADDVGARDNLKEWLGIDGKIDRDKALKLVAPWGKYAGFLYFHLLLQKLSEAGLLS